MATTVSDYTALLSGTYWYPGGALGRPVVLTYSFATAAPGYGQDSGAADSSFTPLTASEQTAVRAALAQWSAAAGVTFIEVKGGAAGDLVFANYALSASEAGLGNYPYAGAYVDDAGKVQAYGGLQQVAGDVYFTPGVAGYSAADALHVALHEIGHALGLKHPFDGDVVLDASLNNSTHTVMSYTGYSPALGDLDVAAAQAIYGKAGATIPGETWSWNASTQTFTETSTLSNDVVRGVSAPLDVLTAAANSVVVGGAYANVIHGGTNTSMSGGVGNDLFYSAGGGSYSIYGAGGTDVAVVAAARPTMAFGQSNFGAAGTSFYIYTGAVNGVNQFQQYVGVSYIEFNDGVFSTAKNKYLDDSGFAALRSAYAAVLRAGSDDASHLAVAQLADKVDAGAMTNAGALQSIVQAATPTSEVATLAYQFFTGKTPSASGMDYLVAANGPNANSLNSAYYAQFSTANRYINFASNLGKVGEGAAAFQAAYGALSLSDALTKAYTLIFGSAPSADKVSHLLHDAVPNGLGGTYEREDYFAAYGLDGLNGQGTKAAMVGFLLSAAAQGDLGTFAKADDAFLADVGAGKAAFGVDLIGAYAKPEYAYTGP